MLHVQTVRMLTRTGSLGSDRTGRWGIFTRPQTRLCYSAAVRRLKRDRSAPRVSATTAHTAGRSQTGSLICMPVNTHTFFQDETFDLEICYKVIKVLQNLLCWIIALWNEPFLQTISISVAGVWPAVMVQFNSHQKGCFESRHFSSSSSRNHPWYVCLENTSARLKQYTAEICQLL